MSAPCTRKRELDLKIEDRKFDWIYRKVTNNITKNSSKLAWLNESFEENEDDQNLRNCEHSIQYENNKRNIPIQPNNLWDLKFREKCHFPLQSIKNLFVLLILMNNSCVTRIIKIIWKWFSPKFTRPPCSLFICRVLSTSLSHTFSSYLPSQV